MSKITTFKKFPDIIQAKELKEFLEQNGIESFVSDGKPSVDNSFGGGIPVDYEVKIKAVDFERASLLVEERVKETLGDVDKDYYLFSFTNEELYDVLIKQDEWNEFDYLLARKLLTDRGKVIDEDLLNSLKKQRIADFTKPQPHEKTWIFAGYVFVLMGGFLGILIGYMLWESKTTLPDRRVIYTYSQKSRSHGLIIFCLGIFLSAIYILGIFLDEYMISLY
ncbi:DUF2007 domain-containing protein [Flavobacterium alkalisoli]|uniref:DUF2007 domain-containing protein n=1 Tax=Flavobacterium alkalisoli TaxID=2602769 RepID=A0A5B9FUF3_9FLAO|nr:DUF2007 domain-containing protein [Flavobacterium alkalisoli]QEE49726.1 DUF2007 domain-containing protein [Flavobacterium alkalisoli]